VHDFFHLLQEGTSFNVTGKNVLQHCFVVAFNFLLNLEGMDALWKAFNFARTNRIDQTSLPDSITSD
jgi:hypothetical protein